MSMFDWQADVSAQSSNSMEETTVVSRRFWIYWVISVPLTIVVLSIWRKWWHREKKHYLRKYPHVNVDNVVPNIGSNIFSRLTKILWERRKLKDVEEFN